MVNKGRVTLYTLPIISLLIAFIDPLGNANASISLALTATTIGFWATGALPEHLTALLFMSLASLIGVASPQVVFSGFESGAFWMVFAGLFLGAAISRSGLGKRISGWLTGIFGGTYTGLIIGMSLTGLALSLIMPSAMGRVILLIPIAMAMADRVGYESGTPARTGLVLAAAFSTFVPAFSILPANVPNLILAGAASSQHGLQLHYADYLILHFPVLGLLKTLAIAIIILMVLRGQAPKEIQEEETGPTAFSTDEKKLSLLLTITLTLWLTDSIHGINSAWIGLLAGLICALPGVALVTMEDMEKFKYGPLFFVAAVIGLGAVIVSSGLAGYIGQVFAAVLPFSPDQDFLNLFTMAVSSMGLGLLTTQPGIPAVMTPMAPEMAAATNLPILSIVMAQVLGFSTVLFPFQVPPLFIAVKLGGESMATATKVSLILALATALILWPLDYLWWSLLGWFS
ncbi:MAG: SLC13 family permease [Rhodospirillales bacterium]|nr:SLC13 family permease [Rhodospirillales bacterium]